MSKKRKNRNNKKVNHKAKKQIDQQSKVQESPQIDEKEYQSLMRDMDLELENIKGQVADDEEISQNNAMQHDNKTEEIAEENSVKPGKKPSSFASYMGFLKSRKGQANNAIKTGYYSEDVADKYHESDIYKTLTECYEKEYSHLGAAVLSEIHSLAWLETRLVHAREHEQNMRDRYWLKALKNKDIAFEATGAQAEMFHNDPRKYITLAGKLSPEERLEMAQKYEDAACEIFLKIDRIKNNKREYLLTGSRELMVELLGSNLHSVPTNRINAMVKLDGENTKRFSTSIAELEAQAHDYNDIYIAMQHYDQIKSYAQSLLEPETAHWLAHQREIRGLEKTVLAKKAFILKAQKEFIKAIHTRNLFSLKAISELIKSGNIDKLSDKIEEMINNFNKEQQFFQRKSA